MNLSLFQIFTCLAFSLFMFKFLRKASSLFDYVFCIIIYFIFNLFLFNPHILQKLSDDMGIGRGVDLFLYVSTIFLLFIVLLLLLKIQNNSEDISKLNRKISILMVIKNKKE